MILCPSSRLYDKRYMLYEVLYEVQGTELRAMTMLSKRSCQVTSLAIYFSFFSVNFFILALFPFFLEKKSIFTMRCEPFLSFFPISCKTWISGFHYLCFVLEYNVFYSRGKCRREQERECVSLCAFYFSVRRKKAKKAEKLGIESQLWSYCRSIIDCKHLLSTYKVHAAG